MDDNEQIKKIEEQVHELYNKFAESISALVRSCETKESRIIALRKANPETKVLFTIYEKAMQNEDYETCAAIREYATEKGIEISN